MIRYEILLPQFYNDGRPIEDQKFFDTDRELIELFGATSTDTVTVRGNWMYKGVLYSDKLIRLRMEVADTPGNWEAVRNFKETLKIRFEQIDIWITAHRVDVI